MVTRAVRIRRIQLEGICKDVMHRSRWLAVLLMGVFISTNVSAVPAIATTAATTESGPTSAIGFTSPTWHWQNPLPQGNSLVAASCPDLHTCYTVGSGTLMVSHNNGQSWSVVFDKKDGEFSALSCPDRLTCYAIANTGPNATAILGTKDGGATWARLWQGQMGLDHLTCPSITVCYAVGGYPGKILMTKNGGRSWATVVPTFRPVDIACPDTNVCYAPLGTGLITSPAPSVAVTTDGGTSWTVRPVGLAKGTAQLIAIRCVSAATCIMIANGNLTMDYRSFPLRTQDGGMTWQQRKFPLNVFDRGAVLTCPTEVVCYAAGSKGSPTGDLISTSDAGRTWIRKKSLPFVPTGIACNSARHCIVSGNGGALVRTGTGWATQALAMYNAVPRSIANLDPSMHAVTCPTRTVCYAGGDYGALVKTTNGGTQWVAIPPPLNPRWRGAPVTTLACPSSTVCYRGSYLTYPRRATVLNTHDGGRTWSSTPGAGLTVVACPGRLICYAGGLRSMMQVTRNDGHTWRPQQTPLSGQQYDIQHLVCPTTRICYATAVGPSEPPPHPRSNVGAILDTNDSGRTWHRTLTDPFPFALACRTSRDCVALVDGDLVNGTVPTLVTHDGGRTWHKQNVLPPGSWKAMTCLDRNTCYLAGDNGAVGVTRNGGQTWQQEQTPTFNNLDAIRCAGFNACYAVGQFSAILARR